MLALSIAGLALLLACAGPDAPPDAATRSGPTSRRGAVGGDVVATVGDEPIRRSDVEETARATGLPPRRALDRLEEESALWARARATASPQAEREAGEAARRAAVQALLERRVEADVEAGAITAEAVAARLERDRARFERPERRASTHLLARLPEGSGADARLAAGRWIRQAIGRLAQASDPVAEAHAIAEGGSGSTAFEAVAEDLEPGSPEAPLDPAYLAALFAVGQPGVVPEPVGTRFGLHALVVTAILPAWSAPRDEAEAAVRAELLVEARAARLEALVAELAARTPVVRDEAAIGRALAAPLDTDAP